MQLYTAFYVFLNKFRREDDPLWSRRVAAINNTDILFVLTVLYSFILQESLWIKIQAHKDIL